MGRVRSVYKPVLYTELSHLIVQCVHGGCIMQAGRNLKCSLLTSSQRPKGFHLLGQVLKSTSEVADMNFLNLLLGLMWSFRDRFY